MPVAKVHLLRAFFHNIPSQRHQAHALYHMAHLTAVCPGIHDNRTAETAGDARCKLKTSQAVLIRLVRNGGKRGTCLTDKTGALHLYPAIGLGQMEHHAADAAVAHQHIAAVSQQIKILIQPCESLLTQHAKHFLKRTLMIDFYKDVSSTTHAEGGVS